MKLDGHHVCITFASNLDLTHGKSHKWSKTQKESALLPMRLDISRLPCPYLHATCILSHDKVLLPRDFSLTFLIVGDFCFVFTFSDNQSVSALYILTRIVEAYCTQ